MCEREPRRIDEELPESFVMPAGQPRPVVGDLVFKRDHSIPGLVYRADVRSWFADGNGKRPLTIEKK